MEKKIIMFKNISKLCACHVSFFLRLCSAHVAVGTWVKCTSTCHLTNHSSLRPWLQPKFPKQLGGVRQYGFSGRCTRLRPAKLTNRGAYYDCMLLLYSYIKAFIFVSHSLINLVVKQFEIKLEFTCNLEEKLWLTI